MKKNKAIERELGTNGAILGGVVKRTSMSFSVLMNHRKLWRKSTVGPEIRVTWYI